MKLGINALGLYPGKIGGAEQYLRNIIAKLGEYQDIETYLFLNDTSVSTFEESERLKTVVVDLSYNHNSQLNGYIQLYQIDVWFCPLFHLIPSNCAIPNVTTIFDIQQDYFPENFDKFVLNERRRLTRETVRCTDAILTISEFSKQTLLEKYSISPDKIKVTYLDADSSFNQPIDVFKLQQIRDALPEEFVLFPANMWPHKNHAALIRGFAQAKEKYNLPLKLVFTGAKERESQQVENLINEFQLRDSIEYLGYVPQDDMRYIYRCATMLAFPSLFEGFGIPIVEAMAAEIPVICSTSSCVPEIAGDAAVLFDANAPEEIAESIYKVYTDANLRKELVEKGKQRRKKFSWDQCAQETVQYLREMFKPKDLIPARLSRHPKVSIVTPSYNQGEYIRDTIESVLNQTYDNIEYIVMDGGSTDETVDILKSYGDRIKWVSEKDGGQADAVNKGIRVAEGEIIGWLNSDDTYYPDAVEKAVAALLTHPEFDMVYGEGDYIDRNGNVTQRYKTMMFDYQELANECFICQPTGFFTKEIAERVGLLNADLQLCMDYEFWMRIGRDGKVLYIPERLATSRMYEENKTMSRKGEVYKECCREIKKHYGYVPHNWLVGYATYSAEMYPRVKRKYHYLRYFFKYNYNRPRYFIQCLKEYLRMRKAQRSQSDSAPALPVGGKYADGWIEREYSARIICCGGENELVVTGYHHLPFDKPMVLTLQANGKRKYFPIMETGPFSLVMPIPEVYSNECIAKVEANQTCSPASISESVDKRELSVQIDQVLLRKRGEVEKPLVSIITPSYNQGEFIRETIESVLNQDYEKIEYIVIDGGSTDNTLNILREYQEHLIYISESDNGQSDAINKGFRMANGQIVAWLNSDDVYEPQCVSKAVEAFQKNPEVAMVYGDGYLIDSEGIRKGTFSFSRDFNLWALVHIWDYIMQPTVFFKADALRQVGYLREDLHWTMDWDLWMKLALRYDVAYIKEYLACSREYDSTKTNTGSDKRLSEILELMRSYTKEDMPYGYEIYYCSELLAHHRQAEERRKEVENRLAHLLTLQPTPDAEHRCTSKINFMLRPYQYCHAIEVEVMEGHEICASFYWNGSMFCNQKIPSGVSSIQVPQEICTEGAHIYVEIHDEDLKNIGNQSDSWVKMQLIY